MLESYQREIARRLAAGAALDDIEAEVIDGSPELDDDERAALWLFAWSYRERPPLGAATPVVAGGD